MSLESRFRAPDGCPDENVLAGFASGALSHEDTPEVERHLDGCAACRELVAVVAAEASEPGGDASAPTRWDTGAPTLPMGPESPALKPGDEVGRYVVEGLLGEGGMGVVYAARDPGLGRTVALKLLRPGGGGGEGRARLVREAQAMARLAHPNVLPLFELGTEGETLFLAMERVEGPTLAAWLRECERPWREVLALFLQAGEGLAAAHRAGLVHRDFKPANVLVGADGRPRVTDFGLVRHEADGAGAEAGPARDTGEALTRAGAVPGTPAYMSPEQLAGREVDARGDQFSFCVALHEALYGVRPFDARARGEARWKRVPVPGSVRPPGPVKAALERGLALEPERRFASMDALLAELGRPPGSRWGSVAVGVVGAGLLLAGADVVTWRTAREAPVVAATMSEAMPLTLDMGSRYDIQVPGVQRVALGEVGVVDVRVVGPETLRIQPEGPGTITMLLWTKDGTRRTYTVTVRPR